MNLFDCHIWGALFWPVSLVYRSVAQYRNQRYDNPRFVQRLDAKIISVGNITVGGTGKTPLVLFLTRVLRERGLHVGIISRGYRRKSSGIVVVSDGKRILVSPQVAGDEPYLLAQKTGAPVVVNSNRVSAGQEAIDRFGCQILIMDDGFQHRGLYRDLDIVVLDASNPWGNGRLLPAGPLREPLSAFKRADAFVFSRTDEANSLIQTIEKINQYSDKPIFHSVHQPRQWISLSGKEKVPLKVLKGKRVLAFTGIGNPGSFFKTLNKIDIIIADQIVFPDHYWYNEINWKRILKKAEDLHAEAIVTTEKDGIRFSFAPECDLSLWMLAMEIGFQDEKKFLSTVISGINLTGV
jgi:tetraacyldisaccharide 4'-kinase